MNTDIYEGSMDFADFLSHPVDEPELNLTGASILECIDAKIKIDGMNKTDYGKQFISLKKSTSVQLKLEC